MMDLKEYEFNLPKELIAQYPIKNRMSSRLMMLNRAAGTTETLNFTQFSDYLRPGDLLVLNDAKVIKARLFARKETGGKVEIFFLRHYKDSVWKALLKPSLKPGTHLSVDKDIGISVLNRLDEGPSWLVEGINLDIFRILERFGHVPLPPYIKRPDQTLDIERYQTVFAKVPGAVAAPTAGLHFTQEFLYKIQNTGVKVAYVTLLVGYGTFKPVTEKEIITGRLHEEYYAIPESTAKLIQSTKDQNARVIAVGTTSVRSLESAAINGVIKPTHGFSKTDIFIKPGDKFKIVDAMVTNFHLPKSSLFLLVCAFAAKKNILAAYERAIAENFRFYSYGDAMFIV